jgi:hypothetical protein
LLIGINRYERLGQLTYCEQDMEDLKQRLIVAGFPDQNLRLLTAREKDESLRPTKDNIQNELRDLVRKAETGDLVVVAFSGHGACLSDVSYLCPAGARAADPSRTMIPVALVYQQLEQSKADHRLLIVDACRNDPRQPSQRDAGAPNIDLGDFAKSLEDPRTGILALVSCSPGQTSMENDELKHGVFTHFIIDGLSGSASSKDGPVTLLGLCDYVTTRTQEYVQQKYPGRAQKPVIRGDTPNCEIIPASRFTRPRFVVRRGSETGPFAEGAEVSLWYQLSNEAEWRQFGSARTDDQGSAQLAMILSDAQNAQGRFDVRVQWKNKTPRWLLPGFPKTFPPVLVIPADGRTYRLELSKAKVGGHPEGWSGSNYVSVGNWKGVPSLRCNAQEAFPHNLRLKLPEQVLEGDFFVEIELGGDDVRDAGLKLSLLDAGEQAVVPLSIRGRYSGVWRLGLANVKETPANAYSRLLRDPPVAFRLERRGNVYTASCLAAGSEPATFQAESASPFSGMELEFGRRDVHVLNLRAGPLGGVDVPVDAPRSGIWQFVPQGGSLKDWRYFGGDLGRYRWESPSLNIGGACSMEIVVAGTSLARKPQGARLHVTLRGRGDGPDFPLLFVIQGQFAEVMLPGVWQRAIPAKGQAVVLRLEQEQEVLRVLVDGQPAASCSCKGFLGIGGVCLDGYTPDGWTLRSVRAASDGERP